MEKMMEQLKEQECLNLNTIGELCDKVDEMKGEHEELINKQEVLEMLIAKICMKNEELKKENKRLEKVVEGFDERADKLKQVGEKVFKENKELKKENEKLKMEMRAATNDKIRGKERLKASDIMLLAIRQEPPVYIVQAYDKDHIEEAVDLTGHQWWEFCNGENNSRDDEDEVRHLVECRRMEFLGE